MEWKFTVPTWITSIPFSHLVRGIPQAQILMWARHSALPLFIQRHIAAVATRAQAIETVFRLAADGPRGVAREGLNRELFRSRLGRRDRYF